MFALRCFITLAIITLYNILFSIYFISESVTTIGTGYFHPTGDEAKLFTMFYVVVGVSLIISFSTTFVRTVLTGSQDELSGLLHRLLYGPDCVPLTDRVIISYRVKLSLFGVFLVLLVGTLFFNGNEGWGWLNSLYWCVCLMTTIGYGDMLIQYESTRVFAIFYIYISVLTFAVTINNIAEYWLAYLKRKQLRERLVLMTARHFGDEWCRRTLKSSSSTAQHNSRLQPGNGGIPGKVDKERFILSVLAELGVLNYRRDIAPLALKFAELDHMNQGYLTHSQLLEFRQTMEQVSRVAQGVAVEYESTENDIFNHLDRSDAYWMPQAPMEASNTVHVSSIDDHKEFKNPVSNLHDIQMSTTRDETAVDLE